MGLTLFLFFGFTGGESWLSEELGLLSVSLFPLFFFDLVAGNEGFEARFTPTFLGEARRRAIGLFFVLTAVVFEAMRLWPHFLWFTTRSDGLIPE